MDEVQKYWRDKVMGIFQWSIALYILLAGWSLTLHEKFELCRDNKLPDSVNNDNFIRAISLISMCTIYGIAFPLIVRFIYRRFLPKDKVDATVLSYRLALIGSISISALIIINAVLTSYFYGCSNK
jgi:hypothetical protein